MSLEERIALAELEAKADELAVLKERAKIHLDEVRLVNKNREDEARSNYLDFVNKASAARERLNRKLDQQGVVRG